MLPNPSRLHTLFEKYRNNTCTHAELQEFWRLMAERPDNDLLDGQLQQLWEEARNGPPVVAEADGKKVLERVFQKGREGEPDLSRLPRRRWLTAAAAAILLLLLAGGYAVFSGAEGSKKQVTARAVQPAPKNDVPPGVTGATLTLGNGQRIQLDSTGQGTIGKQGGIDVVISDRSLQYLGAANTQAVVYNTLGTGRGQQFPVQLSDGSKVLLDAGSTLRYPVTFTGSERRVELTGQAWFEVAKADRPFFVRKGDNQLQVLGTRFNVYAYDEETELAVTLAEGSVRVQSSRGSVVLAPGQQAVIANATGNIRTIEEADVEQAIAWKNGLFSFQNSSIEQVMRDISRWYDVDVFYQNTKPADTFTGDISRQATLRELLSILEMSRVHFKLEDRKLTVLNNQAR